MLAALFGFFELWVLKHATSRIERYADTEVTKWQF